MRDPFWSWNRSMSFLYREEESRFFHAIFLPLCAHPLASAAFVAFPCNFSDPQKMCNHVEEAHWKTVRVGQERESLVRRRVNMIYISVKIIPLIKKWLKSGGRKARIFAFQFFGKKGGRFANEGNKGKPVRYWTCEMRIDSIQTIKCQCDNCAKSYIGNIRLD